MTNPQQPGDETFDRTAAVIGLAALTPEQYGAAQGAIGKRLINLVVRAVRKFGVPLSDPSRKQLAQRLYPSVQQARAVSYVLAVRSMEYSAQAAELALPEPAPIAPYTPDALAVVLENATGPLVKAIEAEARGERPSPVTIIDRRTGMPMQPRDDDHDPRSSRVIYRIGENAGAAVARHAYQAGRDAVQRTADRSGQEIGWARVTTSAHPCAFCVMLASRGPVYSSEKVALYAGADMRAYHNHCDCRAVLVYRGKPWPGQRAYQNADKLWRTATSGYHGNDALNALRRALAAQVRNAHAAA